MTYEGHIENGKVVFDEVVSVPDGTRVRIEISELDKFLADESDGPTLAERLAPVIGIAEGLPEDAAANLDHYLYGTPRR